MSSNSRIIELASIIYEQTSKVDAYLASKNLPTPSFDVSSPLTFPIEVQASRDATLNATDELTALMLGPIGCVTPPNYSWTCVTAIQRFGIANSFPSAGTSTFGEIALACSLSESDTRRLLRQAMTFYIFHEPSPGVVVHTAASKALAENAGLGAYIDWMSVEILPSYSRIVDAMETWPNSEEPNEAGFSVANRTDISLFDTVAQHPRRAERMATAMSYLHNTPGYDIKPLLKSFNWGAAARGLLVDIGGAGGSVSKEIARYLPEIKCIVQDTPAVVQSSKVPEDLQKGERLRFMEHDFFKEQPVKGADIYLLCLVLHDWSDKYATKILSNLIPSLKKGACIVVFDLCLPPPGDLSPYQSRRMRATDIFMKGITNAKERDAVEWGQLFKSANPMFKLSEVKTPKGSALSTICATWEGENTFSD
ncbi:putative O-methyltransferase [Amylocarpus encephaloides]|uniref:O-methyltransferase n=1 Tax=Amylocarpus encephaloides TaxID=45428 RepID=A0A9P7YK83_9HELO|nr:putative O-methyltransferase [Amylocarpus encephaloides]